MFSSTWNRAAIFAAGAMCATAVAQPSYHASWSKVELGAWTLTPVYSEDAGAVLSMDGFLAIADPSTRIGDNIVAVWYERTGAGWSAKSWGTNDPWKAVATVKELMGISDAEDERWDVPSMGDPDATPAVPEEYVDGVLADDPMAALIAASPERDSIILTMTALGYQAADVPVDEQDGCTTNAKLDGMAAAVMEMLHGEESTSLSRALDTWAALPVASCSSVEGLNLLGKRTVIELGAWTVPVYTCKEFRKTVPLTPDITEYRYCRTERWTATRPVIETRQKTCRTYFPPTRTVITQTRPCTQNWEVACVTCRLTANEGPLPCPPVAPPRPTLPPPASIPPTQCSESFWSSSCGTWTPPCP